METSDVFEKVRGALTKIVADSGLGRVDIEMESSLVADLGFTSLMFVDLTLALEEAFQLGEFPMQEWIDEQGFSGDVGFRVQSLVGRCRELIHQAS